MTTATATQAPAAIWFQRDAGWGPWIRVEVAPTAAADAAARAWLDHATRWPHEDGYGAYSTATVDQDTSGALGPQLEELFFPICEHGLSAHLCADPINHYPRDL